MKDTNFPHATREDQNYRLSHLIHFGLIGLLLMLSACSFGNASPSVLSVAPQHIKHIVFFIKENRSFDHYFGTYPGANGTTTALDSEGETIPLQHENDQVPDIDHRFEGAQQSYDDGKMDQFNLLASNNIPFKIRRQNPYVNNSLTQMYQSDIPNYWLYAQNFVLGTICSHP